MANPSRDWLRAMKVVNPEVEAIIGWLRAQRGPREVVEQCGFAADGIECGDHLHWARRQRERQVFAPPPRTCPTDEDPANWHVCANMVSLAFAELEVEKVYGPDIWKDLRWASFSYDGVFEGEFEPDVETSEDLPT